MMWTQQQRLNIIIKIKSTFLKYPDTLIDKQKLISEICMEFGSRREKAAEYIRELLDNGFLISKGNFLELKEKPKLLPEESKVLEDAKETINAVEPSNAQIDEAKEALALSLINDGEVRLEK